MERIRQQHPGKVLIHVSGKPENQGYLWDADDVVIVRTKHRICGLLSGTLPLIPQQNVFLGLPLQLTPEEVTLLVQRGAAILVDDPSAHFPPSSSDLDAFHIAREADIASQRKATLSATAATRARFEERLSLAGSEAGSESGAMSTKEEREAERAREKRAKREEARKSAEEERRKREGEDDQEMEQPAARPSTSSTSAASSMPAAGDSLPPPESLQAAARRSPAEQEQADVLSLNYSHLTHGSSSALPWYRPHASASANDRPINAYTTLADAARAGIWTYPNTSTDKARCAVFEDLNDRGYYMGTGLRFGGDFVVYPGDPLRFHSHFSASVLPSLHSRISALELVASGRLGTAVKKAHLICAVDLWEENKDDEQREMERVAGATRGARTEPGRADGEEGPMGRDQNQNRWGKVTYHSLTWAGFGT